MEKHLPENVVSDILLRLPLKALFKLKVVSRSFFNVISSSYFYSYYKVTQASFLFSCWHWIERGGFTSHLTYANTQEHELMIFPKVLSFLPHPKPIIAIASSHGLVLCRGMHWTYVVCNPLTKQWVTLPPPPTKNKPLEACTDDAFYGFVCYPPFLDGCTPTEYIAVRILDQFDCNWQQHPFDCKWQFLKMETFSSSTERWEETNVELPNTLSHVANIKEKSAVVCDGILHWMNHNDLIMYDPRAKRCRTLALPSRRQQGRYSRLLDESAGHVWFIHISGHLDGQIIVCTWVLEKASDGPSWSSKHVIIHPMTITLFEETPSDPMFSLQGLDPLNPNILFLESWGKVVAFNLLTKAEEVLCSCHDMDCLGISRFIPYHPWTTQIPGAQCRPANSPRL